MTDMNIIFLNFGVTVGRIEERQTCIRHESVASSSRPRTDGILFRIASLLASDFGRKRLRSTHSGSEQDKEYVHKIAPLWQSVKSLLGARTPFAERRNQVGSFRATFELLPNGYFNVR